MKWNLSMVLICISFTARDGEHFFMLFWPFGLLPLKKLFSSVAYFFIGSLILGEFSFFELPIFWLSVLHLMYSYQIFSLTLWVVSSV
jgi:hypothetical protein